MTTTDLQTTPDTTSAFWGSYALGVLEDVQLGPAVLEYLQRIEDTLRPYGGAFLAHGAPWQQVEGDPLGEPVLIGFPSPQGAQEWYASAAYQGLLPLRTRHSRSRVLLIRGVDGTHRSTDVLPAACGGTGG